MKFYKNFLFVIFIFSINFIIPCEIFAKSSHNELESKLNIYTSYFGGYGYYGYYYNYSYPNSNTNTNTNNNTIDYGIDKGQSCMFTKGYAIVDLFLQDSDGERYKDYDYKVFTKDTNLKYFGKTDIAGRINISDIDPTNSNTKYKFLVYNSSGQIVGEKDMTLECGKIYSEVININELNVVLKMNNDENILKYKNFNVYSKDSKKPYQKGVLVAGNISTGVNGYAKVILPQGAYVIEVPFDKTLMGRDGNYYIYDAAVSNSKVTRINYKLVRTLYIEIKFHNPSYDGLTKYSYNQTGTSINSYGFKSADYVCDKYYEIYTLKYNEAGIAYIDTLIKSGYLSSTDPISVVYPGASYTIKLIDSKGAYSFIENVIIGENEEYNEYIEAGIRDFYLGGLLIYPKDANGNFISELPYTLYKAGAKEGELGEKLGTGILTNLESPLLLAPGKYSAEMLGRHYNESPYYIYDFTVEENKVTEVPFSRFYKGATVKIRNADRELLPGIKYSIYTQIGDRFINMIFTSLNLPEEKFEVFYPSRPFGMMVDADGGLKYVLYGMSGTSYQTVNPLKQTEVVDYYEILLEFIRVLILNADQNELHGKYISLFGVKRGSEQEITEKTFLFNKPINEFAMADIYVPAGEYLLEYEGKEYNIQLEKGKKYELEIDSKAEMPVIAGQTEIFPQVNLDSSLIDRLKGKLLLQVEESGRIWYVNQKDGKRYEVTFKNALPLFEKLSLGISNIDLNKIKTNLDFVSPSKDSDGDGFNDKGELLFNYNPFGTGKIFIDSALSQKLKGLLLLQVEQGGRIWYLNPDDLLKYEVTWENLLDLFVKLSLGITNEDINKIPLGQI